MVVKHHISHDFGGIPLEELMTNDKGSIIEIVFDNDFYFDLTLALAHKIHYDYVNFTNDNQQEFERAIEGIEKYENGEYDYLFNNVGEFINFLSRGPVACGIGGEERVAFLKQQPAIEYFESSQSFKAYRQHEIGKLLQLSGEDQAELEYSSLKKIQSLIFNHKEIRIWYDKNPNSIIGFCYLCKLLETYTGKIYVMDISIVKDFISSEDWEYDSWEEVANFNDDDEFIKLLEVKNELSDSDKCKYAEIWKKIEKENANERIVICNDTDFSIVSK